MHLLVDKVILRNARCKIMIKNHTYLSTISRKEIVGFTRTTKNVTFKIMRSVVVNTCGNKLERFAHRNHIYALLQKKNFSKIC